MRSRKTNQRRGIHGQEARGVPVERLRRRSVAIALSAVATLALMQWLSSKGIVPAPTELLMATIVEVPVLTRPAAGSGEHEPAETSRRDVPSSEEALAESVPVTVAEGGPRSELERAAATKDEAPPRANRAPEVEAPSRPRRPQASPRVALARQAREVRSLRDESPDGRSDHPEVNAVVDARSEGEARTAPTAADESRKDEGETRDDAPAPAPEIDPERERGAEERLERERERQRLEERQRSHRRLLADGASRARRGDEAPILRVRYALGDIERLIVRGDGIVVGSYGGRSYRVVTQSSGSLRSGYRLVVATEERLGEASRQSIVLNDAQPWALRALEGELRRCLEVPRGERPRIHFYLSEELHRYLTHKQLGVLHRVREDVGAAGIVSRTRRSREPGEPDADPPPPETMGDLVVDDGARYLVDRVRIAGRTVPFDDPERGLLGPAR